MPFLQAIAGFRLVTADLARLAGFYEAIGFRAGGRRPIAAAEMRLLGLEGEGERLSLEFGASRLDLDRFERAGQPYPPEATAADPCFQHFALVTGDAAAAWTRAEAAGGRAISRDGAVTLPAAAGGVTAMKFRDPDGHPLEWLQFPGDADAPRIDHSALAVADLDAGRSFYETHGLAPARGSLNGGPTQEALDGLPGVEVDVAPMRPATAPPHVELLGYRRPRTAPRTAWAANDIVATRIVWRAGESALIRDPDGHLHQLMESA